MEDTENKKITNKREALNERFRSKYPEKDFNDDEALFGQISDDFDEYDKTLQDYKNREQVFSDMFTSDPRSASFLTDWRKGEDPYIGLIRRFGVEIKDAIDDPDKLEQISAANKEYLDRVAKSNELEQEYEKNINETLKYLDDMSKRGDMSESDIDDAMEWLGRIVHDGVLGKFTPETIEMAIKAIKHDDDVANASHVGEVRGRNGKIEEKLRSKDKGDGLAQLDGQNNNGVTRNRPSLGALDNFGGGNQSIWERGGMKRTKYSK